MPANCYLNNIFSFHRFYYDIDKFHKPNNLFFTIGVLLLSCIVMAFGLLLEIKTEVVFLPGDGIIVAISQVLKKEFGKIKPYCDMSFVIIAVILSFVFLGYLAGVRKNRYFRTDNWSNRQVIEEIFW